MCSGHDRPPTVRLGPTPLSFFFSASTGCRGADLLEVWFWTDEDNRSKTEDAVPRARAALRGIAIGCGPAWPLSVAVVAAEEGALASNADGVRRVWESTAPRGAALRI